MSDKGDLAVEQEQISFTATAKCADFECLCTGVTLHATEDCHISFDGEVATTGHFLLKADTMLNIPNVKFTKIWAIRNSSSGKLYIMARR